MPRLGRLPIKTRRCPARARAAVLLSGLLLWAGAELRAADLGLRCLAGWTHSRVNYESVPGIGRPGFGLGLEAWPFRGLGIEVDVVSVQKGYHVVYEDKDRTFSEISVPLLLKARFFLDASSSLSLTAFGGAEYSSILTEMDPNYGQHDFGIVAGASLEKRLDKVGVFVEGRYDTGLLHQSDEYMPSRFEFKTRTLFLLAGITLHL